MMRTFTLCLCGILYVFTASAQYSAGVSANFGIDGDLRSDYHLASTLANAAGTDDWFQTASGTGLGVIDTTGTAQWRSQLIAGQNITFNAGMAFPRYSV